MLVFLVFSADISKSEEISRWRLIDKVLHCNFSATKMFFKNHQNCLSGWWRCVKGLEKMYLCGDGGGGGYKALKKVCLCGDGGGGGYKALKKMCLCGDGGGGGQKALKKMCLRGDGGGGE